jgi:hypothetical protein
VLPALLGAATLQAQSPGDLVRVRGTPTEGWRTGRLVALTDSVLVVRIEGGRVRDTASRTLATGDVVTRPTWTPARNDTMPLAAVRQFEVRRHQARRGRRAVVVGLVGGLVGGLLLGTIAVQSEPDDSGVKALAAVAGGGVGGAVGLVAGAVTGAVTAKPTRWEPVALPRPTPP